jgi:hypothetical protein
VRELIFTSPEDAFLRDENGEAIFYRLHANDPRMPMHFECSVSEQALDRSDSPDDPPGPDKSEWAPYVGRYVIVQWGKPAIDVRITRRNGYLYLNGTRLVVEQEAGLFFTADGEIVDFRANPPVWKSLRLIRSEG